MKKQYKHKLLSHIIMDIELPDLSVPDILKKITLKNVVYPWISAAWNEGSSDSLRKVWKHLLPKFKSSESSKPSEISEDSTLGEERMSDEVEMAALLGTDF